MRRRKVCPSATAGALLVPPAKSARSRWRPAAVDGQQADGDEQFRFLVDFEEWHEGDSGEDEAGGGGGAECKEEVGPAAGRKRKRKPPAADAKRAKAKIKKAKKAVAAAENAPGAAASCSRPPVADGAAEAETAEPDAGALLAWTSLGVAEPLAALLCRRGFAEPTEIQRLALPQAIVARKDVLGAAETGSGKTLAFGLPIVTRLLAGDGTSTGLRAVVVTPTRELAVQIKNHMAPLCDPFGIGISTVVGGLSVDKQRRLLRRRPAIVVGTPGRLWALMDADSRSDDTKSAGGHLSQLDRLQFLVIDETDRLMERGHFEQLGAIVQRCRSAAAKLSTYVYSATLTYAHPKPDRCDREIDAEDKVGEIARMAGLQEGKYELADVSSRQRTARGLVEARIDCDDLMHKDTMLYHVLVAYAGRTLVFANSIDAARRLYNLLGHLRLEPLLLHAKMHQGQRLKNLERFAANDNAVLLATDVAARGLDIARVDNVVHYQVPRTAEVYVHRSGRTARAALSGLAIMLVDPTDAPYYRRICDNLAKPGDLPVFPVDKSGALMSACAARLRVAAALDRVGHKRAKRQSRKGWFRKMAEEADLAQLSDDNASDDEDASAQREMKAARGRLDKLLAQALPRATGRRAAKCHTRYLTAELVDEELESRAKKRDTALAALEVDGGGRSKAAGAKSKSARKRLPVGSKLRAKGAKKAKKKA